jgi:hypothetical protein
MHTEQGVQINVDKRWMQPSRIQRSLVNRRRAARADWAWAAGIALLIASPFLVEIAKQLIK